MLILTFFILKPHEKRKKKFFEKNRFQTGFKPVFRTGFRETGFYKPVRKPKPVDHPYLKIFMK